MPYIVVHFKGEEVGRWPLEGVLNVGRSTECDVVVRDILLSRRHCRIQPYRSGWVAVDDDSKNGTYAEGRASASPAGGLPTAICFGWAKRPSASAPIACRPTTSRRASDLPIRSKRFRTRRPRLTPAAVEAFSAAHNLPAPRPVPKEPEAFARDDLYGLLTDIASSSWDSIYAQASRPKRPIPHYAPSTAQSVARPASPLTMERGGATALLSAHRPRSAFAEELQVQINRKDRPPVQQIRSASKADRVQPEREEIDLAAPAGALKRVAPLSWSHLAAMAARPLRALHGWIKPANRVRLL